VGRIFQPRRQGGGKFSLNLHLIDGIKVSQKLNRRRAVVVFVRSGVGIAVGIDIDVDVGIIIPRLQKELRIVLKLGNGEQLF
jgi:hypothetical protein